MRSKSVLIVEDDRDLLETIKDQLEAKGFSVQSASRLGDAQFKLRNQRYDCLLLDLHLEGGDGETIITSIKSDRKSVNYNTPILVMSGHLDKIFLQTFGPQLRGVFVKPFESQSLLEKVSEVLS